MHSEPSPVLLKALDSTTFQKQTQGHLAHHYQLNIDRASLVDADLVHYLHITSLVLTGPQVTRELSAGSYFSTPLGRYYLSLFFCEADGFLHCWYQVDPTAAQRSTVLVTSQSWQHRASCKGYNTHLEVLAEGYAETLFLRALRFAVLTHTAEVSALTQD